MTDILGSPEEVLAAVQAIAEEHVPGVVCELQSYKTAIGCGALNGKGRLYEVTMPVRRWTEYIAEGQARALASQVASPKRMFIR